MDHKYTLDEIDRMRAALRRKYTPAPMQIPNNAFLPGNFMEKQEQNWAYCMSRAEDELRTCMIGGVRPDELEAKYPAPSKPVSAQS